MIRPKILHFSFILFYFISHAVTPASAFAGLPKRIVSLSPSISESLYLLKEEDHLVGVTSYCRKPIQAQKKEKVGSIKEVSVEKIISLNPDLVIAISLTNQKTVKKLRSLGIQTVIFSEPENYAQLREQFMRLARLVGKEGRAAEILDEADKRIARVREKVRGLRQPDVFVQIGAKPLFAATKKYIINDFIEFAGARNIAGDAISGFYSREEVLRRNPQVILIVTMGLSGEQEKETWEKFTSLEAVRNKRVYFINSEDVCSTTMLGFASTLEKIAFLLHPELLSPAEAGSRAERSIEEAGLNKGEISAR